MFSLFVKPSDDLKLFNHKVGIRKYRDLPSLNIFYGNTVNLGLRSIIYPGILATYLIELALLIVYR